MAKKSLSANVRNLARSGENYRHLRWRVYSAIREASGQVLTPVTPFLAETFFSIKSDRRLAATEGMSPVFALPFLSRDWAVVERLMFETSRSVNDSYLRLLADYIKFNVAAVRRLSDREAQVCRAVLDLDGSAMLQSFAAIDYFDKQSLFTFKLYCALNFHAHQNIADYFAEKPHSDWVKQRLLYPLIYYFLNLPSDGDFAHMLDQIYPDAEVASAEKAAISLLLQTKLQSPCSLALKCYVALLCHPFDALDVLALHFEEALAENNLPSDFQAMILREVAAATGSERLSNLIRIIDAVPIAFLDSPTNLPICARLGLPVSGRHLMERFVSCDANSCDIDSLSGLYAILARLRWSRLPEPTDFTDMVAAGMRYRFCELGRLIEVLLTSIYMVERSSAGTERRDLIRHLEYFGVVSPFTVCSPRGASANSQEMFGDSEVVEARVSDAVRRIPRSVESRWWIKKLHWNLRVPERRMQMPKWLSEVRESVSLSGNMRYLSGVDWAWIDQVVAASRVKPFAGNPDGIYVLLLRSMEQKQREPNILKLSLAPKVPRGGGLPALVDWLTKEYGADAIAFVRFFLTPAMIMKMQLEANYTAALSERLNALDNLVERFGISNNDIMTSEQYAEEQRTLTTALMFMALGAAQFEISWETFRADAHAAATDNYKAFQAFNKTYNTLSILTRAKRSTSHVFSNKQAQTYEFENREWPIVSTIISVVDTFLGHPTYGIEAILAIRIRHDNLRREFAVAIAELRRMSIYYVTPTEKQVCLKAVEEHIYPPLQKWIDQYMHAPKATTPGLFNFVPSQIEMATLVKEVQESASLDEILDHVLEWIKQRLAYHLSAARRKLLNELKPALVTAISDARNAVISSCSVSPSGAEKVAAISIQTIERCCDELIGWFDFPQGARKRGLTFDEMRMAVEGRFSTEISTGELAVSLSAPTLADQLIPPDGIRPAFDLWSELVINAIKYSGRKTARLRIKEYSCGGLVGLRFSSYGTPDSEGDVVYRGQPSAVDGPVLGKGKSGLLKVAAISAALVGSPIDLRVARRRGSFHVFVPLRTAA